MNKIFFTITILLVTIISQAQELDGALSISSNINNATIKLNNKIMGKTPLDIIIKPGTYTIEAEMPISKFLHYYYKGEVTVVSEKFDDLYLNLEQVKTNYKNKFLAAKGTFMDYRDEHIYKFVTIGTQTWMAENLDYKTNTGSWAYDNNENFARKYGPLYNQKSEAKYGRLYNWKTAKTVCPEGWHIPSDVEWTILTDFLGGQRVTGKKLKNKSSWLTYSNKNYGTNSSGFNALPSGSRRNNSGEYCYWWSSTPDGRGYIWLRYLYLKDDIMHRDGGVGSYSVRCLKSLTKDQKKIIEEKERIKRIAEEKKKADIKADIKARMGIYVDDRDNKTYKTIKIDTQVWMAENLAYLPEVCKLKKNCGYWVYGYDGKNVKSAKTNRNYKVYGVLYNWETAKAACPSGWHLPSDAEWKILADYLDGENVAGKKLKSNNVWKLFKGKSNGNNESNFNALPGGYRDDTDGLYYSVGKKGYWWTNTMFGNEVSWTRLLNYEYGKVGRYYYSHTNGYSVRCLKD